MSKATGTARNLWFGTATLRGVFGTDELSRARRGQEAFYRGEADLQPAFSWPLPRPSRGRSRKHPYASFFRSELAAVARSPVLASRIAGVTGADSVRFWHDQLLAEAPRKRGAVVDYQWHTERSRWKTCDCTLMVTAWIPLEPVTPEMGPIEMAQGSERNRWIDLPADWEPEISVRRPMELGLGDVSLHCWHTVHGNPPNFGTRTRRVMAVHFALGPISYRPHGRFRHVNERLVRQLGGVPDFQDERVCPVVRVTRTA